jgi:magnesium transporter
MNFNPRVSRWNMPELNWTWGYPMVLAVMLAVVAGMLGFFYRKGWMGAADRKSDTLDEQVDRALYPKK